jgi:hypothetical protein
MIFFAYFAFSAVDQKGIEFDNLAPKRRKFDQYAIFAAQKSFTSHQEHGIISLRAWKGVAIIV